MQINLNEGSSIILIKIGMLNSLIHDAYKKHFFNFIIVSFVFRFIFHEYIFYKFVK